MSSDTKRLVLVNRGAAAWLKSRHHLEVVEGTWLQVNAVEDIEALSRKWKTPLVCWDIETTADVVMIETRVGGREVRRVTYAEGGWELSGKAQAFENGPSLQRWLKRKRLLASPDGYEVLAAFLGSRWDEENSLAHAPRPAPQKPLKPKKSSKPRRAPPEPWELCSAAATDSPDAVKGLLARGADPNGRDQRGGTALHATKSPDVIKLLVAAGADLEAVDDAGETPLLSAASNLNPNTKDCVRGLLAAGADPHARRRGKSVVTLAKDYARSRPSAKPWAAEVVPLFEAAMRG